MILTKPKHIIDYYSILFSFYVGNMEMIKIWSYLANTLQFITE